MQNFMIAFTAQHVTNLSRRKRRKFNIFELISSFEVKCSTLTVLKKMLVAVGH